VYYAVVLDTFLLRVVGWSIDASQTAALVSTALGLAIDNRAPALCSATSTRPVTCPTMKLSRITSGAESAR
jgi:transposase InsO family protein